MNDDTAQRLAPHLEHLRSLKWLEFRGTQITDEALHHIEGLSSLERLFVRPSNESGMFYKPPVPIKVTHVGLESVASLKNLKLLSLNNGEINGSSRRPQNAQRETQVDEG